MIDGKGGDDRIYLAELEKLDKKLGGVTPDKEALKKLLDAGGPKKPSPPADVKPD